MKQHAIIEKKKGITLVELIIVIVIMMILAAFLVVSLVGYIDKSKGSLCLSNADLASVASESGLAMWISQDSPGNSDKTIKINIEKEIIKVLDLGDMQSFTETNATENVVQIALSLPSYFSQGWSKFVGECESNNYRNFVRVWVGKNKDMSIGTSIKAIYYVSADGRYASRIVYDDTTKLGSAEERTGTYYERIK